MFPLSRARSHLVVNFLTLLAFALPGEAARWVIPLEDNWQTVLSAEETQLTDLETVDNWKSVTVPHNWDDYFGYRQLKHGNLHGTAWYRRQVMIPEMDPDQRAFLYFEGIGSYADIYLNGKHAGSHAGGLTTFTLDATDLAIPGRPNSLLVRAHHPAGIRDLPWVCGGCEQAYGFSEGSQPFGIFRPAHLVITRSLRIEPWGIHIWNGSNISADRAELNITAEIRNYSNTPRTFVLRHLLISPDGTVCWIGESEEMLEPGEKKTFTSESPVLENPRLWSLEDPCLYTLKTELVEADRVTDSCETGYGVRWLEWPDLNGPPGQPFKLNGEPVFINGVADYEHLLGGSHAFSAEMVDIRANQVRAAGFNAFRDAHHPHNLRFNKIWDREGILWWTQFGAHIWFENEAFKDNYKALLRDWIRERRNSPSLFLYGLQNESKLPADFARECVEIMREMDPTASIQRPIVTCNGGEGTDWDVPQNWSGTYGGDLQAYNRELVQQRLVGEYGAWRSIGYHSEGGFIEEGPLTEDRMAALMETKVRLADTVREQAIGHFAWPLVTHNNPGRNIGSKLQQASDGIREWDRIGPANNKGLLTIWGEPLDVYYMYRSNFVPAETEPMVYIVSHTWPDRWTEPGLKDGIIVYSNAEEVELFNGYKGRSLGIQRKNGTGTHFRWDKALIKTNVLYAEARIQGRTVATDIITLHHLPGDPNLPDWDPDPANPCQPIAGRHYLYRVNVGGPTFVDSHGSTWMSDQEHGPGRTWGARSWASAFPNLPPQFGSKRETYDPVRGTVDDPLFQSFRYGRHELAYTFEIPDGQYAVDLYFIEPWYGTGGGMDCTGWRLFDVAVNGQVALAELDIWKEAGHDTALRKTVVTQVSGGVLEISFPSVKASQAILCAIAISSAEINPVPVEASRLIKNLVATASLQGKTQVRTFLDTGVSRYSDDDETIHSLSWELRESEWIQTARTVPHFNYGDLLQFELTSDADVFVTLDPRLQELPDWLQSWDKTTHSLSTSGAPDIRHAVFRKHFKAGETVTTGQTGHSPAGSADMYTVIVKPHSPPPPAAAINGFAVYSSSDPNGWKPFGNLKAGRRLYSDGGAVISRYTTRLGGCDWIRTPITDAANPNIKATFMVEGHAEVFVGIDARVEQLPDWLKDWIPTGWSLEATSEDGGSFDLLKRRLKPGEPVSLFQNPSLPDGSPASMYCVLARQVRPDQVYQPPEIEGNRMDWIIKVGVGDRYGLNFTYRSPLKEPIEATLQIISTRDDRLVCEDTLTFSPSKGNDWEVSRNRTCDDINAGTYFIRLQADDLNKLSFAQLQVE